MKGGNNGNFGSAWLLSIDLGICKFPGKDVNTRKEGAL